MVITRNIADLISNTKGLETFIHESLKKHITGNWGNLIEGGSEANKRALEYGNMIVSFYLLPVALQEATEEEKVCIITDACQDPERPLIRQKTTVLLPSEY